MGSHSSPDTGGSLPESETARDITAAQSTRPVVQFSLLTRVICSRVCKDPPYKVEESGYAGFILPIEVYFKNKEEPKKVRFDYDLFLHLEGHPPVNHLRCEKLTFNNPTEEFRRKLLRAGGVMVMQEGSTSLFCQHMNLPTLPNSSLTSTFSHPKKSKSFHGSKNVSRGSGTTILITSTDGSVSKLHKPSKDHKEKPPMDLKEPKSAFRDSCWDPSRVPKDPSRKPKENKPIQDINPKMGFKEPKSLSNDHRTDGINRSSGLKKRLSTPEGDDHLTKKCKKRFVDSSGKQTGSDVQHSGKKHLKDRSQRPTSKLRAGGDGTGSRRASRLPSFQALLQANDSNMEGQSTKSDSEQLSPASSSSSSGFAPTHHKRQDLC